MLSFRMVGADRWSRGWATGGSLLLVLSCAATDVTRDEQSTRGDVVGSIQITPPDRVDGVPLGQATSQTGAPLVVACETCHSVKSPPQQLPRDMTELRQFHLGLSFKHGNLPCGSCHTTSADPIFHLADGTLVERADVLQLCAQCHGPQYRDYKHGSHGGMNGYWDLSRGSRVRNHCVDCHAPHTPAIEQVLPAPGPKDRFFESAHE